MPEAKIVYRLGNIMHEIAGKDKDSMTSNRSFLLFEKDILPSQVRHGHRPPYLPLFFCPGPFVMAIEFDDC